MSGKRIWRDFRHFPKIKKAYLNTIQKLIDLGEFEEYHTPENVLRWWISGQNKATFFEKDRQEIFCFDN
jgi:hypothetical protein